MAWYKTGTITVTNGSTTVTGSGTSWITGAGIGEALYAPDGRIYEIANIVSATQLTLGSAYLGSTASGQAYQIVPTQSYIRDLAQQAAQLVADYAGIASNAGTGKFGDGTLGAPGIRFVSDEDTGFFRSASNEVKFVAGGVEQFKFNSSGVSLPTGGALVGLTSTQTLTNKTISADNNTLSGLAASSFVVSNASGNIDGSAAQKVIPAGAVVGTTDTQTLTNKTLSTGTAITAGTINGAAIGGSTPAAGAFTTLSASDASVISVNSASTALRITQTGAGNALVVEDSANPDSTPFVVDTAGRILTGHTTSVIGPSSTSAQIQVHASNLATGTQSLFNWANSALSSTQIAFNKSKSGTIGTLGAVASGDLIGAVAFYGDDGTSFVPAANITASVDGTPGTNDMPGRLVFSTTRDGASSPTEAMRIDNQQRVGIGATPFAGTNLFLGKTITGAVTSYGIYQGTSVQSDVTSGAIGYMSSLTTQAASFTLPSLIHYRSAQSAFGAGSTVTNQYGFEAASSLTGATNNYGFYSNIASGTGRWNFYAAGTAANYFAGNVGIGTTSAVSKLDVKDDAPIITCNASAFAAASNGSGFGFYQSAPGRAAGYSWSILSLIFTGGNTNEYQTANVTFNIRETPTSANLTEVFRIAPSKLVSLQNNAGFNIARTAVTAPAVTDGNVFSGTYTPTLTNQTNISSSTAGVCQYMRVGNVVTVSGQVSITATASGDVVMRVSLPVASNFAGTSQLAGMFTQNAGNSTVSIVGGCAADATNDVARFRFNAPNTDAAIFNFHFTYQVI